jgi:flagellar FliJ protein
MGYRFSLATVLRFREIAESREELMLEMLMGEIARTRRRIEQAQLEICAAREARTTAMREPLPAFHIQGMLNDMAAAEERCKSLLETLESLEQRRVIQMQKYQAAHRDRKMLSDMAARQHDAYELDRARAQQKALDDLFAARAQRNN